MSSAVALRTVRDSKLPINLARAGACKMTGSDSRDRIAAEARKRTPPMTAKANRGSRTMRRSTDRIMRGGSIVTLQAESVPGFAAGGVIGGDLLALAFLLA